MKTNGIDLKFLGLLCLSISLLISIPSTYSGIASAQNNTLMQPDGIQGKSTNATNIVIDKYNTLEELKKSTIPTLLIMGDRDIGFHVEDWYPLIGDLESTQVIVLPRAGHGPQHQYPNLVANYITGFIHGWK